MRRNLSLGLVFSLTLASLAYAQPSGQGQDQQAQPNPPAAGQGRGQRPASRPSHNGARPGGGRPTGNRPGGGGPPGAGQPGAAPGAPGAGPGAGGRPGGGRPGHERPTNRPPTGATPGTPGRPGGGRPGARPPTGVTPEMPVRPGARPPGNRPVWRPGTRPNAWRRPTGANWFWHGRAMRRFRAPAFVWPHGFAYRRWSVGSFLPRVFLTNAFFWNDWWSLGLPAPPPGFAWVRVGPDLLLVDLGSGRVVDAAWGVFF